MTKDIDKNCIIRFFDGLADGWDEYTHHDLNKIKTMLKTAGVTCAGKTLDIACGTGVMFGPLSDLGASQIIGIDISPKMIEKAREKYGSDKRITLIAGDVLDYKGEGFDLVTVYSAYPHFSQKEALADHVADMLKTGGRFAIMHSQSKEEINARHHGKEVTEVSVHLHTAEEEAEVWQKRFEVDVTVDNADMYIISGVKK